GVPVRRWPDLPRRKKDYQESEGEQWRVHAHVPLGWAGAPGLGTTRDFLTPEFFRKLALGGCPHAEIETYTYSVLPASLRGEDVTRSIAAEFDWVLDRMSDSA
ncbi:MAG: hypothetical protein U1E27_04755, partial [Kiritimatiellia bacterium]|nr:hypothetical protein [Kiritimatiellia bacterium]